ncbi:MAG: aminotransferase class V-fold PLP-dependent enzyme [Deltaproteobacteria bacterium]|nr:aminotransferase class V-fold PLP-dependent enzyme [Deltaproteobacteria bacterium]
MTSLSEKWSLGPFCGFWRLDPAVTFLNHGSYGACPHAVLAKQQALRDQIEANPVRFFSRDLWPLLEEARETLAAYVRAPSEDVAFVPNATAGVNAVLVSLAQSLTHGDELLTIDHAYNACKNALVRIAEKTGARVVVATLPLPVRDPESVTAAVLAKVTARTKLALIDHVTSPSAFVLPVAEIVAALSARGIDTLVDGAHAPGQIAVDLGAMQPAYYTANCHKWMCAPKGSGFLYVRRDRQGAIHPLATSHGLNAPTDGTTRFRREFDWTGTDDPSAYLCVPEAIRVLKAMHPDLPARNRKLAAEATALLAQRFGWTPSAPAAMRGSMGALLLPPSQGAPRTSALDPDPLQDALARRGIEIPVMPLGENRLLRLSAHGYNTLPDYERLADAVTDAAS